MKRKHGQQPPTGDACECGGVCLACQAQPAVNSAVLSALVASTAERAAAEPAERLAAAAIGLIEGGHVTLTDPAGTPHDGFSVADDAPSETVELFQTAGAELAEGDEEEAAEIRADALAAAGQFTHASMDGSHSHAHPAYGAQGDDTTHEHEHSHANDSNHGHEHSTTAAAPPADAEPAAQDPDASRLAASVTASLAQVGGISTSWGYLPSADAMERSRLRELAINEAIAIVDRSRSRNRVTAATEDGMPEDRWHAYIFVEGIRTTDHRAVAMGATSWRDLPLPLEWARSYEGGHYGKVVVGAIETIEKVDGPLGITLLYSEGTWDLDGEDGAECARQVDLQGGTRWVSADVEVLRSHTESAGGGEIDMIDIIFGDVDDDWYDVLDEGRIMGATVLSTPAFPQCVIAPGSVDLPLVEPTQQEPDIIPGLVAAAVLDASASRASGSYFDSPGFTRDDPRLVEVKDRTGKVYRGCPLTIEEPDEHGNRRVFGHIALWGFCHTGFPGECVLAPRSRTGYAYYRTGEYRTAEGDRVPVGQLTIGTKHADGYLRHTDTVRHYDHTGTAVADLACGEDDFGIWVAGVTRADITEDQLRAARASSPSGDWRLIGGEMEMVAVLDVNVPGFPVPRSIAASLVAAGAPEDYEAHVAIHYEGWGEERRPVSLVAAGRLPRNPLAEFVSSVRAELAGLREELEALRPLRSVAEEMQVAAQVAELDARIGV